VAMTRAPERRQSASRSAPSPTESAAVRGVGGRDRGCDYRSSTDYLPPLDDCAALRIDVRAMESGGLNEHGGRPDR
jgi:hypothetical protein